MRWFRFVVFICFVTLLQAGLMDIVAVTHLRIKPDLLLILLVFFAVYCDSSEAIITAFTIGFAADVIGPAMGPHMISFGLFGTLLAYLCRIISIRKIYYQSLVIFIVGLLVGVSVCFLTFLKGQPISPDAYAVVFGTALYSSVVGPFLFLLSVWLMNIKIRRFARH
jgi:rod shape-determining protein MreD